MFVPEPFKEDRLSVLHETIVSARLMTLVTAGDEGLEASHVPILLDAAHGPYGMLIGHISRANPQWRRASPDIPALAIFTGPDAYISPSWYPSKRETGKVVPTWNYVAVHAYGPIEFFDDAEGLRDVVTHLTERHEAGREEPWAVTDAPEGFVAAMLKGIVGFRLPIDRLEGKWKMSQNRPRADRIGTIEGLRHEDDPRSAVVAALIPDGPDSKT